MFLGSRYSLNGVGSVLRGRIAEAHVHQWKRKNTWWEANILTFDLKLLFNLLLCHNFDVLVNYHDIFFRITTNFCPIIFLLLAELGFRRNNLGIIRVIKVNQSSVKLKCWWFIIWVKLHHCSNFWASYCSNVFLFDFVYILAPPFSLSWVFLAQ